MLSWYVGGIIVRNFCANQFLMTFNLFQEQQLLLLGANDTLMATMDHLALANLLNGDPQKAAMVRLILSLT